MLLLHGEADRLCLPEGSVAFHAGLPHDAVAGSQLHTYPGMMHEIFNEPEREQVYRDLVAWVNEREPS
jgi:alpha-beta hydrolase superfamily lysophospholipase